MLYAIACIALLCLVVFTILAVEDARRRDWFGLVWALMAVLMVALFGAAVKVL